MPNNTDNRAEYILQAHNISKTYKDGTKEVCVFKDLNIAIKPGERVAITGLSGSGKTTLLYLLGGLDNPNTGHVDINGTNINEISERKRAIWRNLHLSYVFQNHYLLREFNAIDNVSLPLRIRGVSKKEAYEKARYYLSEVGLSNRAKHHPQELSGGQAQRVAIAQALVGNPRCVLLDEPTGNLDTRSSIQISELLLRLSEQYTLAVVLATHNKELAADMQHKLYLNEGVLTQQLP